MNNNKTIIIICISLIAISIVGYFLFQEEEETNFFGYQNEYIKDYKINEIIPIYISNEEIANKYLSEYVSFLLNDRETAYDLLTDNEKNNRFKSMEQFNYYIDSINGEDFRKVKISRFSYSIYDGKKTLRIYDSAGNNFKFIEESIMNYKVEIN